MGITATPTSRRRAAGEASPFSLAGDELRSIVRDAGRLQRLVATLAGVGAASELFEALHALLRGAVALLDGVGGTVSLFDPETGRRHSLSLAADGSFEERRDWPAPEPGTFQWRLWQGEGPILIDDYAALDAAAYPLRQRMLDSGYRSAVNVPIDVAGPNPHRLGALCINSARARRYTEEDRALAAALAAQAAAVVERARSQEQVRALNTDLERRVEERTAQLEAANRELEAFTYSVAHDLRAPLRAMDGFSRILVQEYMETLPSDAQRYLKLVRTNAQQMGELVDDLLTLSRLGRQPLNLADVAPAELVEQSLELLRPEREQRQVELAVGELPPCLADPVLLKQVYVNLLANAFKFTRGRQVARIEVGSRAENGACVYFVKDNGVGFDMRYAHKLFGVFQRLHRAEDYEGTGVGLAIVQRVVSRHGGRVWAEAAPNAGATFSFTLTADVVPGVPGGG